MADTRDRLLAATNELFRTRGFHGTGMKDVIRAAGATTGSLYHHFPGGKVELAEAVIVESGAAYGRLFEVIADEATDPASGIGAFFDGAADVLEATGFIDVCPIGTVAREVASTEETLRLAAARAFDGWIETAASRFERAGMEHGDARSLAATVVAALEGGFLLARSRRDATVLREVGRRMTELVQRSVAAAG